MGISNEFNKMSEYLYVKLEGDWTHTAALESIDQIKLKAESEGMKLILLDLHDVSTPEDEMVRFYTGQILANMLAGFKIAAYSQSHKINRFTENVAVNRGATFRIFDNSSDAVSWLTDG